MSILSLSTENKDKLLQLIQSLQEIFEQKDILTQKAEPFVKRMKEINAEKESLDKKSEKYNIADFKSTNDANELSNIILKSKQLDEEIEVINISSKSLNVEFNEIINQENEIVSKIKKLVELASKNNNQLNKSISVEKLGINVFVFRPGIPDIISIVDRDADEIINCEKDIVDSLSKVYFDNSIEIIKEIDKTDFKELEKYFLASKAQKEQSIDERLAFIQKNDDDKDEEKTKVEEISETIKKEVPKQDVVIESMPKTVNLEIPNQNVVVEQTKETINPEVIVPNQEVNSTTSVVQNELQKNNNILSLDSILKENKEEEAKSLESITEKNKTESVKVIDPNIIIIKSKFDNSHSKIANSNNEKIKNIINNFKGTFVLPIIKSEIISNVETQSLDPISSFINPKAA